MRIMFFLLLVWSALAMGMDAFEIQVYDSEINEVGQASLETHWNSAISGIAQPNYPGQVPNHQLNHLTFEGAYGMAPWWEMGAYLQSALLPNGNYDFAGVKFRNKFVIPRQSKESSQDPWQWGVNFEISYLPQNFEHFYWACELRPILGYTWNRLTLTINPILDLNFTNNLSQPPSFDPATKIVFDTRKGFGVGLEYYGDFGELPTLLPGGLSEQYLFAAFDLLKGPIELNFGVGVGLNSPPNVISNATVAKMIYGFDF